MNRTRLITGSILVIFLLLMMPNIPALEQHISYETPNKSLSKIQDNLEELKNKLSVYENNQKVFNKILSIIWGLLNIIANIFFIGIIALDFQYRPEFFFKNIITYGLLHVLFIAYWINDIIGIVSTPINQGEFELNNLVRSHE